VSSGCFACAWKGCGKNKAMIARTTTVARMVAANYKHFAAVSEKVVVFPATCWVFQAIRIVQPQLMNGSLFAPGGGGIYDRRTRRTWLDPLRWIPPMERGSYWMCDRSA